MTEVHKTDKELETELKVRADQDLQKIIAEELDIKDPPASELEAILAEETIEEETQDATE